MSSERTIVLVTGANSGIGFDLVAQLLSDSSKHVLLGCRSSEKGETALKELQSRGLPGTAEVLVVDVASEESINKAAELVGKKHGRLDALVNNAAVGWSEASLAEKMAVSFQTNATGVCLVVEAFMPLLQKSTGTPRIVNVSSGAGSLTRRVNSGADYGFGIKGLPYSASKAAMNLITAAQAKIYGEVGCKVFAYSPGFCVSNLGPHNNLGNGARPASEGAAPMVGILNGGRDSEHGCFLSSEGQYPW